MSIDSISSQAVFDRKIATMDAADRRFQAGFQPVALNDSVAGARWDLYLPQQGSGVSPTGIPAYNTAERNGLLEFDISMAGAQRSIDMKNSYLNLTFRFEWVSGLGVASNMKATDSVPFDLPLRILDQFSISSKGASAVNLTTAMAGNELRRHIMQRMYLNMDGAAAAENETFLAPIMEQQLDTNFALSAASTARSANWCQNRALGIMRSIPLSWLSPPLDKQTLLTNVSSLHIGIQLLGCNNPALAFGTYGLLAGDAYVGQLNVYVSDVTVSISSVMPSAAQVTRNMVAAGKRLAENIGDIGQYLAPAAFNASQLNLGEISNLQCITWGFQATNLPACVVVLNHYRCINQSQFAPQLVTVPGNGADVVTFGHGVSSVSVSYGQVTYPERTLMLDTPEKIAHLYQMYRLACHRGGSFTTRPFIDFASYTTAYQIFALPVVNAIGYVASAGTSRCYVNMTTSTVTGTSQSAFNNNVDFVRHSFEAMSILTDGTTLRQAVAI